MREGMDGFWQMKRTKSFRFPLQSEEAGRGKRKLFPVATTSTP